MSLKRHEPIQFLEHIKLPHYVDFQSELELVRKLRREAGAQQVQEAAE
jgi:alpha-D-ribose 1-methylphosphonate 5-triphosphate synthase subunit PhnI